MHHSQPYPLITLDWSSSLCRVGALHEPATPQMTPSDANEHCTFVRSLLVRLLLQHRTLSGPSATVGHPDPTSTLWTFRVEQFHFFKKLECDEVKASSNLRDAKDSLGH